MKNKIRIAAAGIAVCSGMALADFEATFDIASSRLVYGAIHVVWATAGTHTDQITGNTVSHVAGDLIGNETAGTFAFNYTNSGTDGGERGSGQYASGGFSGFCIELQSVELGPHVYSVDQISNAPNPDTPSVDPMNDPLFGGPAYDAVDQAEVEAVVAAAVRKGWINADLSVTGSVSDVQLAAIQGLIWDRVFNNAVVSGNTSAVAAAMSELEVEVALVPSATMPQLRAMLNANTQDQLFVVPLPTAVFAGLLTLGGLGGLSRIRRR